MSQNNSEAIDWLLAGDPAIRWQVQRDLLGAPEKVWRMDRELVATEGWGARMLECRNEDGGWGQGHYAPKWTSTTYTLLQLRDFGLDPACSAAHEGAEILLDSSMGKFESPKFAERMDRRDQCVTGMLLSIGSYFGVHDERLEAAVDSLLSIHMTDGAWNCRHRRGAVHSSFHTTFNVLEGLQDYLEFGPARRAAKIKAARDGALEFMLQHQLFKSDKTGEVINSRFLKPAYPTRWHYDVLRGLDFFQRIGAPKDSRLAESIEVLNGKCDASGRWPQENRYAGQVFFHLESLGKPSRWNTLRTLRVLNWWKGTN